MRAEHLAIDGALITLDADADLSMPVTASGWAMVPSLQRAHPFTIHPPGHRRIVEQAVRSNFEQINFRREEEYQMKGGSLRVFEVELPTAVETRRVLVVGAWEGERGCLATSVLEAERDWLVEMFDTLPFREYSRGLVIESQIVARPRPPEVVKEIPEVGVVTIRPAIPSELQRVPRGRGREAPGGELFRIRPDRRGLMLVGRSSLVTLNPFPDATDERVLRVAGGLRAEWTPQAATVR